MRPGEGLPADSMTSGPYSHHVLVCSGAHGDAENRCRTRGGEALAEAFRTEIKRAGLIRQATVTSCDCLGLCRRGPVVIVHPDGHWYTRVALTDVAEIVNQHLIGGRPLEKRAQPDGATIRSEISLWRARQRKLRAARREQGVLPRELESALHGFEASRALLTAVELDLFTAIGDGASVELAATRTGTAVAGLAPLLNALVTLELLHKRAGRFTSTALAADYLRDGAAFDARATVLHLARLWEQWSSLTNAVRAGAATALEQVGSRGPAWTEAFIDAMHATASARAPVVVAALDLSGANRILDLGGGSGAYAIELARRAPAASVTLFDRPAVVEIARRYAAQTDFADRIHTLAGDLHQEPYGEEYDLIFASAVCHMCSPDENRAMFRKCHRALRSGGSLVVHDFIMNEDKTAPSAGALFALQMLVATPGGGTYSAAELTAWLTAAGFLGPAVRPLPGATDVVVATRG